MDFQEILDRVTIRDILVGAGFSPSGNRIPCPVHDGDNPTSFSFTDVTFCCFSCGASGGLIDLIEHLHGCDRTDAMKQLWDMAGIPMENLFRNSGRPRLSTPITRNHPYQYNAEYSYAADKLDHFRTLQRGYESFLRILRRNIGERRISISEFLPEEQLYHYKLEHVDEAVAYWQHEVNRIMKRSNRERRAPTSGR